MTRPPFTAATVLALLAAILLVIGGAPARAAAAPCNPCPPDCPMMAQMAKASADHHAQSPAKSGKADNPCKAGLACQAAYTAPIPPQVAAEINLTTEAADHFVASSLGGPSHPPDPGLRPPIQL